jgi:hypothetical protein
MSQFQEPNAPVMPYGRQSPNPLMDFLLFRRMITPIIIQALFWIGSVFCILLGFAAIVGGANAYRGGGAQVLGGLAMIVIGPVMVRIYCELLILFFRMNETLTEIKNNTSR